MVDDLYGLCDKHFAVNALDVEAAHIVGWQEGVRFACDSTVRWLPGFTVTRQGYRECIRASHQKPPTG